MFYSNSNTPNIIDNTLGQGKKLLNYNKSIYDITSPNFELVSRGRVIESMSNHELSDKDKKRMVQLEELENNFNRTLSEYNNVYQQFNEDLMNRLFDRLELDRNCEKVAQVYDEFSNYGAIAA